MTFSNSAAHAAVLPKQDSTNGACAADEEKIKVSLAENAVNKITEAITYSNSTANVLKSCKQDDPMVYMLMLQDISPYSRNR